MVVVVDQEDFYDGNGLKHQSIETVQCRQCGAINRTAIDVVAQHWVDHGCPDCQLNHTLRAFNLLERAGFTAMSIQDILENGLNHETLA